MTVEQWLRGHFGGVGKLIEKETLLLAAISPAEVEPEPLRAVSLTDEYEDYLDDAEYKKGVLYALSTSIMQCRVTPMEVLGAKNAAIGKLLLAVSLLT